MKSLPHEKLVLVFEFVDFIEQKEKNFSHKIQEMTGKEVLIAAEKTGTFDFLNDPSNDIYTLEDGEPL
ncbi:MAG: hypothetical protein ABRQ39_30665 [Candidatus Eremiobacterota bacterium]